MIKLIAFIERIPWQLFLVVLALFLFNIASNVTQVSVVIISAIGCACMTYLAVHNFERQRKR
jgi:hypothetical protein